MSCQHPIDPGKWLDYLDGGLAATERSSIEAHVADCAVCRSVVSQAEASRDGLIAAAESARRMDQLTGAARARMWDGIRFRIRRSVEAPQNSELHLERLRGLVAYFCGHATARVLGFPDVRRDVSSIVQVMCGDRAGHLVRDAAVRAKVA